MLEWILEALGAAGFARKDVVFICGYRAEVVRAPLPRVHVRREPRLGEEQHPGVAPLRARAPRRRLRLDVRRHRLPRLGGEEGRRLAARQGPRLRHRLAPPLRRPRRSTPRATPRRCAPRATASSSCRAASRPRGRAASSSASPSSPPDGAREMVAAFDEAQRRSGPGKTWREGRTFEQRVPHRSLPGDARARLGLPPRRHARRLHGDRHAAGPRERREVVARVDAGVTRPAMARHRGPPRRREQALRPGEARASRAPAALEAITLSVGARASSSSSWARAGAASRRRCASSRGSRSPTRGRSTIAGRSMNGVAAAGPRRRDGLPGLRALPADDRARDPRVPAQDARASRASERDARGRRGGGAPAHREAPRPAPGRALRAASGSGSRWAGPSSASRASSSSTSRSRTSTPRSAATSASRSASSSGASARPRSTSRTTTSRR